MQKQENAKNRGNVFNAILDFPSKKWKFQMFDIKVQILNENIQNFNENVQILNENVQKID